MRKWIVIVGLVVAACGAPAANEVECTCGDAETASPPGGCGSVAST